MDNWFDWRGSMRAQRGGLEPIILSLLKEQPMHGYEIIKTLEERSHGFWRPSAGSVYPILQLLEDQDLVASKNEDGKKVYSLTKKGHEQVERQGSAQMPWHHRMHGSRGEHFRRIEELRPIIKNIIEPTRIILRSNSKEAQESLKKVLMDTAKSIEDIAKNLDSE